MSTYNAALSTSRSEDFQAALAFITRQRHARTWGAMGGMLAVVIALFATEAAMLSQEQAPGPMSDPEPGRFAPWSPD